MNADQTELALGDFNGDRLPDVFVASFARDSAWTLFARPLEVWLNTSRRAPADDWGQVW